MSTETISDYADGINQKLYILLRDKREKAATPRMESWDQWIVRLFQIDSEWPKVNDDYSLGKKVLKLCRLVQKIASWKKTTYIEAFNFVTAYV